MSSHYKISPPTNPMLKSTPKSFSAQILKNFIKPNCDLYE